MNNLETIRLIVKDNVATIWLSRPKIHNAFNERMIEEIKASFESIASNDEVRIVILRGEGASFCAGADLNWMKDVSNYTRKQNLEESLNLSECFYSIYSCPKPTLAMVQGAAIGGANGLLAACDIVIADEDTVFSLSEVKIGIVPACISPYIIKRVGEFPAKELMLTGMRFKGEKAQAIGLVNESVPKDKLEETLGQYITGLMTSGPKALSQCKVLIDQVVNHLSLEQAKQYTAEMIADIRSSDEGQEGMNAFLEKRKPNWIK